MGNYPGRRVCEAYAAFQAGCGTGRVTGPRPERVRQGHPNPREWDTVDPLDAVCEAILDSGASVEQVRPAQVPVDWRLLRGIPAIGRGVRGVVPGSQPGGNLK